jgi:hypothetical protein
MDRDRILRGALWVSVPYNAGAAAAFAFPGSRLGRLAEMPVPVPAVYGALLAAFTLLFAGAYAWQARAPKIDRPLVILAACGKAAVVAVLATCWACGAAPLRLLLLAGGDAVLACVFAWWLVRTRPTASRADHNSTGSLG